MADDAKKNNESATVSDYQKGADRIIGLVMYLEECGSTKAVIDAHVRVEWNHHATTANAETARGIADACRDHFKKS